MFCVICADHIQTGMLLVPCAQQTTLLSIPVHDVRIAFIMFDTDDSGTLDRDEFKKVLTVRLLPSAVPQSDRNQTA